jgi:O-antigen chain-terminating methyltransferase
VSTERLEDKIRRLERERDEADRRYNDALTAVDRANPGGFSPPKPISVVDEHQLAALNEAWKTLQEPAVGGLKGRLAAFVWRTIAPTLQRQLTFNSLLVDHLNRSAAAGRESLRAQEQLADALEQRFAALNEFTARLLIYLQQITGFVETKERHAAAGALVLNAAVSGLAAEADKRAESMDVRLETRTAAIEASHESLRTAVAVAQQAAISLKREVERLLAEPRAANASVIAGAASEARNDQAFTPTLDAFKYVGFEDRFRGSREVIRERLGSYVPFFSSSAAPGPVLDVGCGRGEFLELLSAASIPAAGLDLNHEMVELCRSRGLKVTEGDAVSHLSSLPDGSLGGLFAAQVVEHLQPAYLLHFLELAFLKVAPGGTIVLETLNPACWVAFFDSYIRDITHVWPLHPETLHYLVLASGFSAASIEYRSPVPDEQKLEPIPPSLAAALPGVADTLNENVAKLNARLFTYLDYAVVGKK